MAFHYEVCAKLVEQRGGGDSYEGPTIFVKLANRPQLMRPVALRCTKRLVDVARQYPLKKAILIGAPPLFAAAWRGIRPCWTRRRTPRSSSWTTRPRATGVSRHRR